MGIISGLLALAVFGAATPARAARPRIAVLGVSAERLSAEVRDKLAAAVAGGLAASGADVVDSATTAKGVAAKGLGGCETSTCRIGIAEATGARYLLRGTVELVGRSYTVHLEMIDGTSGTVVGVREDRCEICTESEAYETASFAASSLKAEVLKRPAAGPNDDGSSTPKVADLTDPTKRLTNGATNGDAGGAAVMVSTGAEGGAGGETGPRLRAWSWVGIGAGVAALGAGIVLVKINGQGTCTTHETGELCPDHYTTRAGGFGLIGGGLLAAALGATLLIGRF